MLEDLLDVGQESHVEHPIRFIQDEELDLVELGVRPAEMVEEPPGGRDDDVHAAAERVLLRSHADATKDRRARDRRVHAQLGECLRDLRRELARGREHQRARDAARLAERVLDDREEEGDGLAAAGCGACEDVPALEGRWNGVGLNGSRAREAQFLERLGERGIERECTEWHGVVG